MMSFENRYSLPSIELASPSEKALDGKTLPHSSHPNQMRKKFLDFAPPKFKTTYGGKTILFSDVYCYERQHYPIIFAYVEGNIKNQLEPRIFYYSNSRAIWRVAPGFVAHTFSKGNLGFSCDIPPELNVALTLHFNEMINTKEFLLHQTPESFVKEFIDSSRDVDIGSIDANEPELFKLHDKTENIPNLHVKIEIEKSLEAAALNGNLPDLSRKIIKANIVNPFYKKIFSPNHEEKKDDPSFSIFLCPSVNNKYLFLYASVKNTLKEYDQSDRIIFLLTAGKQSSPLNSFCVAADPINLGYQSLHPIVHATDDMIKNYMKQQTKDEGFNIGMIQDDTSEDYFHFEVISQFLPLNQLEKINRLNLACTTPSLKESKDLLFAQEVKINMIEQLELAKKTKEICKQLNEIVDTSIQFLKDKTQKPSSLAYKKFKPELDKISNIQTKITQLLQNVEEFETSRDPKKIPTTGFVNELQTIVDEALENPRLVTAVKPFWEDVGINISSNRDRTLE